MRNPHAGFKARRPIRLSGYDDRQCGIYFVKLCAFQQAKLFGEVSNGTVTLSALGEIVIAEWRRISSIRRYVKLDHFAILPNHFHGLVVIDGNDRINGTKSESDPFRKETHTLRSGSLGAFIGQFKLAVGRHAKRRSLHPRQPIWQRNHYEHIVRDEESLNDIRRYIIENPGRWDEDRLHVE